jgi:phenylacetate-CoA ligase
MVNIIRVLSNLQSAKRRLYWKKEKLQNYQAEKLRRVVKYADQNVPFYHKLYRENGIDVSKIQKIDDLSKLPIIKKDLFKKQDLKEILSAEYNLSQLKRVRTSGSSGTPFEFYITPSEDAWRKAIYMRANISCGQKPRDRWVVLTAPHHFHDTTTLQRKLGLFSQTCVSLWDPTEKKIEEIAAINPHVLDGYSGSLVLLAKAMAHRGLNVIKPRLMFGNAEAIDLASRRYIEKVFGAPYCDQYGSAEVDRASWQCLERQGYHMDVDSVITEFVDKNGERVADGEQGEVVFTSLFNFAMPLLRYAIGDVGSTSDDICPCGRTLPLMKMIEGRKDSFLTLPGGRLVSPMIFNFVMSSFKYYADVDQYHIRQKKIDLFEVSLKMVDGWKAQSDVIREFESHIRKYHDFANNEVRFDVSIVDEIARSPTGKLLSVSSDLTAKTWLN